MVRVSTAFVLSGCLCLAGLACTQQNIDPPSGSGGSSGSGNGGSTQKGGTSGGGGSSGSGGTTNSGGSSASGGTTSAGGSSASGGKSGTGGSGSGGASTSGGTTGNGGTTSAGGSGSGGKGGSGGSAGSGGAAGSSAKGGSGGTTGLGGGTSAGGSIGDAGSASCTITQSSSISPKIGTVGIVKWSTTQSGVTSAHIDFGLDTNYGMTAPVPSPTSGENTTLLLGMKQSKTYHYRITTSGSGDCVSSDYTIATNTLPSGLPKMTVTTKNKTALFGGFLITGQFLQSGGGSPSYILDADGDMVWAYTASKDVTGAVMDYAGTHMWINAANVPSGQASVRRVTMDGQKDEDLSSKFTGLNHQLTVLPDETVAFYAYSSNGCDDIKEYSPSGTVKTIVNAGTAIGGATACHVNNIQYSKEDDTLVFSELDNQVVAKVKRSDGSTVWLLNSTKANSFTGDTWKGGEHGIHLLGLDHLMIFNNNSKNSMGGTGTGSGGDGSGSIATELKLDLTAKKVTKAWTHKASDGTQNDVMGDLQRLSNGNTIIAFSTQGYLEEVDASGALVQTLDWPIGASFGYIQKRATLYGPPPR